MYAPQIRHFASLGDRFEGCRDVTDGTIAKSEEYWYLLETAENEYARAFLLNHKPGIQKRRTLTKSALMDNGANACG